MKGIRSGLPLIVLLGSLWASSCTSTLEVPVPPPIELVVASAPIPPEAVTVTPEPGPLPDPVTVSATIVPIAPSAPADTPGMRPRGWGDEDNSWPASGLWVGGLASFAGVLGDFQDGVAYVGPSDVVIAPALDEGYGYGAMISYRWVRWEMVFAYEKAEFDGNFLGMRHDTELEYFDLYFRQYMLVDSAFQPFFLGGVGWSKATVENGSTDGMTTQDGVFKDGVTFNIGLGLAFYPIPWVNVFGQGMFRYQRFGSADGVAGETLLSPKGDANSWELQAGVQLRLLPARSGWLF